jgi:hypothetical protein
MYPSPANLRPQFSLFGLLAVTALFCVVFALLAALQTPVAHVFIGFLLFGGLAGVAVVIIEAFAQLLGLRR